MAPRGWLNGIFKVSQVEEVAGTAAVKFTPGYLDALGDVRTALSGTAQWTTEQIRDTGFVINWLRHDQDDYFQFILQFNHNRKLTTAMKSLHVHAIPGGAVDGNVYWSYAYTWVPFNQAIPAVASWTTGNATTAVAGADQHKHKVYNILTDISAPGSDTHSSILLVKLSRLGTSGNDTYTDSKPTGTSQANFGILYVDAHFTADKIGSFNEMTD